MFRYELIILVGLLSAQHLFADTVFMRDGRRFDGTVVSQNRVQIVIMVNGSRQTLEKAEMMRIVFDDGKREAEMKHQQDQDDAARRDALKRAEERKAAEAREAEDRRRREALNKEAALRDAAQKEKARKEAEAKSKRDVDAAKAASEDTSGALFRSAFVPGWGHFYQGRTMEAAAYGFGFVGAVGLISKAASSAKTANSSYNADVRNALFFMSVPGDGSRLLTFYFLEKRNHSRSQQYQRARSLTAATLLAAGIYGGNLLTVAYFDNGKTSLHIGGGFHVTEVGLAVRF